MIRRKQRTRGRVEVAGEIEAHPSDSEPLTAVEEIALALERGEVTFPMVVKCLYLQWPTGLAEHLRKRYEELYPAALSQFMTGCGGVRESFYADEFTAGVVLTGTNELFSEIWWDEFTEFDTAPARALEADINDLRLKASLYLSEDHRRICMERLIRLYKGLISSLRVEFRRWRGVDRGHERAAHPSHISDLEQIRGELQAVRTTYRRFGAGRGEARYITGAALGAVAIVALAGVAAAVLGRPGHAIWLGAIAAGAIGALLSVLERLTHGNLRVLFEAERLLTSGVSRPVVGAISGLALFGLVEGNIVPLDVPATTTERGLFFAGTAFLLGFSERLAKDVFGNAASSLPGGNTSQRRPSDSSEEA